MDAPDHISFGSGINALVCAAMLSEKKRVIVLQRNDRTCGCLRTDEVTAPGFVHDVMATTFVLFITSPPFAELGKDLARHGLEFSNTNTPTGVLTPDGSFAILTGDCAANAASFNVIEQGDGDQHAADVGSIEANAGLLFAFLAAASGLSQPQRCWRKKPGNGGRVTLLRFSAKT